MHGKRGFSLPRNREMKKKRSRGHDHESDIIEGVALGQSVE